MEEVGRGCLLFPPASPPTPFHYGSDFTRYHFNNFKKHEQMYKLANNFQNFSDIQLFKWIQDSALLWSRFYAS